MGFNNNGSTKWVALSGKSIRAVFILYGAVEKDGENILCTHSFYKKFIAIYQDMQELYNVD